MLVTLARCPCLVVARSAPFLSSQGYRTFRVLVSIVLVSRYLVKKCAVLFNKKIAGMCCPENIFEIEVLLAYHGLDNG